MKNKVSLLNVISSLLLQMCNIISTFIIPKIILSYFGSNVNGLVASLTQFLSYIALIEGGVTGVITAKLYKPLVEKEYDKVSSIINTAKIFYRRIAYIFILYSFLLAIVYPIFFNGSFSFIYIFILTIILSLTLLIQYMYSLTLKTLLTADKKVYIVSFAQIIIIILNVILALISVKIYPNIHILKLISGLLFLVQPIIYNKYVKKNYKLDKNAIIDNNLLKDRWNGFAINIAAFIHFGTDITILTIFTNFSTVSIYSVYALVTAGLRTIISSISTGVNPTIGQSYAKDTELEIMKKIDVYEYINNILVFFFFSIAGLLIVPFVMIYTKGVVDVSYYQPLFGVLLLISEAIYLLKLPHLSLAYAADKFKELTYPAFIEAFLNIFISILLVKKFGLIGIAVGTICGMLYRLLFHIYFNKKIIKLYSSFKFYLKILIFSIATLLGVLINYYLISPTSYTIINWIYHSILYSVVMFIIYSFISFCFYKKELLYIKNYIKNK